jgi:hypothetical protein
MLPSALCQGVGVLKFGVFRGSIIWLCLAKIPSGRKMGLILSQEAVLEGFFDLGRGRSVTMDRREGSANWTTKNRRAHFSRCSSSI